MVIRYAIKPDADAPLMTPRSASYCELGFNHMIWNSSVKCTDRLYSGMKPENSICVGEDVNVCVGEDVNVCGEDVNVCG